MQGKVVDAIVRFLAPMLCVFRLPLLFLSVLKPTEFIVNSHLCTVNKNRENLDCLKSLIVDTLLEVCTFFVSFSFSTTNDHMLINLMFCISTFCSFYSFIYYFYARRQN